MKNTLWFYCPTKRIFFTTLGIVGMFRVLCCKMRVCHNFLLQKNRQPPTGILGGTFNVGTWEARALNECSPNFERWIQIR